MYQKLDKFISGYMSDDYWYDEGFYFAQKILIKFSDHDWEELSKKILTKSLDWQKKLAYCLHDGLNKNELKILLQLIVISDNELFEIVIDSLRTFADDQNSKELILKDNLILQRINDLLPISSLPVQMILKDFLKKLYY